MELESQILNNNFNNNNNLFSDSMPYDIISPTLDPITNCNKKNYNKGQRHSETVTTKDSDADVNRNSPVSVRFSTSMMPPPPHKIVNYSYTINRYQPRDFSSKGYESDESWSPPSKESSIRTRISSRNSGGGFSAKRLDEQTVVIGKYSHSFPTVCYHSNLKHQNSNANNNNGNYKNRCYTNSNINSNNKFNNNNNNNNNNKRSHRKQSSNYKNGHNVSKKVYGLVERFKSKAEVMRILPNPPNTTLKGPLGQLNKDIWRLYKSKAQNEITYENKINSWKNIFLYLKDYLSNYGLYMVGSTMSGFGLINSDIDMCLLTKSISSDPRLDALHHLNAVRHLLIKNEMADDPQLILAKVPILKFKEKQTGFEIDLNCNSSVGIKNTQLLYSYSRLDWRVRPLVIIVKIWAQENNINDAKKMTVSSYSWVLMVIHYLQCKHSFVHYEGSFRSSGNILGGVVPPVLPCLHGLLPSKFGPSNEPYTTNVQEELPLFEDFTSDNRLTLAELFVGFFEYYSSFDFNRYAISVRAGCSLPVEECRFARAPKNDPNQWKYLCIEEPFDYTNTARSVFDSESFRLIRNVIGASYERLSGTKLLADVLPLVDKRIVS
ncbi:unnamed protein product [Phyllotreta striolata]|uniref:Uncharacterized protein n=1 Tax=Phyllotreta striolata TaxID=444603 RepID=A0A9N9XNR9_PHYSR|nr:unnamed protein product [Phyllotreta striolata]